MSARREQAESVEQMPGRPWRPGGRAYWERIAAITATAPPLTLEQRAELRVLFHQPTAARAEAA